MSWTRLIYTFTPPVGTRVTGAQTVPGTGSANASTGASASVVAGRAVLTLSGPIDGGTTSATSFTPPAVRISMTATGAPATTARTGFAQFAFTRSGAGVPTVPGAPPATQTVTCPTSSPSPVTSRTRILDVTPPRAALTAPAHGGVYTTGDAVTVDFGCSDLEGPVSKCTGTATNGSQLPTGSAGTKSFKVDATDAAGNVAQAFASYVVHPATVTYTANVDWNLLVGMHSASNRFGIPIQDIPKAGVGLLLYLARAGSEREPDPDHAATAQQRADRDAVDVPVRAADHDGQPRRLLLDQRRSAALPRRAAPRVPRRDLPPVAAARGRFVVR